MKKAMEGETDIRELEFYVTVEYYKTKKHTTSNVEIKNPSPTENKKPSQPTAIKKAKGSPAEHKPRSKKEEKGVFRSISETIDEIWDWAETQGIVQRDKPHTIEIPEGKSPAVIGKTKVEKASVETIIDVYFAKEEFTKETTEKTGTHQYKFQNENKNIDKDKIATIIKKKVDEAIRKDKKYSKLDDIKAALTKTTYAKNEVISFDVYKLGSNLVKINNAPLEEEIYIVAKTVLLEGKEVNIKIKEKEEILIAKAADLPIQEAKKDGAELTTLKATVEKGEAKIKIKLRPKSDGDLKKWKEKLAGIKDGQHTYTFGGKNDTSTDAKKKTVAGIIIKKIKDELAKNKKFAKSEDIVKTMANASYDKGEKITFDTYKVPTEYLWLQAECQGSIKKYEGEFLKKDGEYFEIGKKCECEAKIRAFMRVLRIAEGTGEYVKDTKTARDPQLGYTTWFSGSGNNFTLSDDHPRIINSNSTNTLRSSAAGAYQIMSWKFDELNGYEIVFKDGYYQKKDPENYIKKNDKAKKYDAKGFSQLSQDRLCVIILKDIGTLTKLLKNDIKGAISNSSGTWVSLPGATAGQPTAKMQETLDYYDEFLKEELSGKSHLHIKSGFLKDFEIKCNCKNESSSDWHHPLDRMELRGWYGSGFYPGDSDHGDAEVRISKHHEGLDLYAPIGTTIYACVEGEVYEDYYSNTYGNTLGIKGTYNGQTYYFFYAHLSERNVAKGASVSAGDIIGKTGQSGNASGQAAKMNHLHFEVRNTSARTGGRIDPLSTIKELNRDVITNPDKNTQTGN
ncbi:hypothetical protein B0A56_12805 [Flavobacterium columnare NBRC 100251 = ATCC 23463]|nr:hypothetical protein B0A56_12805 [Flavobacterium columnare NBRC 100251 = ATCC 23463]